MDEKSLTPACFVHIYVEKCRHPADGWWWRIADKLKIKSWKEEKRTTMTSPSPIPLGAHYLQIPLRSCVLFVVYSFSYSVKWCDVAEGWTKRDYAEGQESFPTHPSVSSASSAVFCRAEYPRLLQLHSRYSRSINEFNPPTATRPTVLLWWITWKGHYFSLFQEIGNAWKGGDVQRSEGEVFGDGVDWKMSYTLY